VVVVALLAVEVILGALILWTYRRLKAVQEILDDSGKVRRDLDVLRSALKNLDEMFESYKARAAQRASTDSKNLRKGVTEMPEISPPILTRDDIVRRFEHGSSGA